MNDEKRQILGFGICQGHEATAPVAPGGEGQGLILPCWMPKMCGIY